MDINVNELKERIDAGNAPIMIDVRNPHEWDTQHLAGVQLISLHELPSKLEELADFKDKEVVMICRSGGRSGNATKFLTDNGFTSVRNMVGGMLAWKAYIDPSFDVS